MFSMMAFFHFSLTHNLLFISPILILFISFSISLQDSGSGTPVTMRVDPKGFFLYWIDQNNELDILDIATIRDVRTGQYAKKPKVRIRINHYFSNYFLDIIILMCDLSISLISVSLTFWQLQRKAAEKEINIYRFKEVSEAYAILSTSSLVFRV